jgi:hypothetical protein
MDVLGVVSSMVATDLASADLSGVRAHLGAAARVRSWLDAQEIEARRRLEVLRVPFGATADQELARAGNKTRTESNKVEARARTCTEVPQLAEALTAGDVTGTHLDLFERGLRGLEPDDAGRLIDEDGDRLVGWRAAVAGRVRDDGEETVAASRTDGGIANLDKQKRAARLKTWTDQVTGMVHLHGQFDPESGMTLVGRLRNVVEDLFHDKIPDTCPTDAQDKQDHLRALAMVAIVDGRTAPRGGRT